jgi:uncharacterized protein
MFIRERDGVVISSASDLSAAAECEWALMRRLDAKLGRIEAVEDPDDPMKVRAGLLGGEHERRVLQRYLDELGPHIPGTPGGVAVLDAVSARDDDALDRAHHATLAALRDGAAVVYQAAFATDEFVGFADFLVRTEGGGANHDDSPAYEVYDTKLARRAKITALLQLAAYADQLQLLGIPTGPRVHLLLGDGSTSTHHLTDIAPVFADRWARLRWMIDERVAADGPIPWEAPGYAVCGRCAECAAQVEATRDVLLVAGMRSTQRIRLAEAGIRTIDQLAASHDPVAGIGAGALAALRDQARMQLAGEGGAITSRVYDPSGLAALPEPDPGDIFFDFEGDPLWTDGSGGPTSWNLEYLFGVIEHEDGEREHFRPFWAHDRAEEKRATVDFLQYVRDRRLRHPGMHIYHYADYERSHLQQLCARHGVGEQILDELLEAGVFVDLYPIVKRSIRISAGSYSLKKVEQLYMGDELRTGDVTNAADSVQQYVGYCQARDAGRTDEAQHLLAEIADYNRYDCVSTLRLRDWLLGLADAHGVPRRPAFGPAESRRDAELTRREDAATAALLAPLEGVAAPDRDAEQTALALAAAAIDYHRREDKSYWWEHFNREIAPVETWEDQRDALVVHGARVDEDWAPPVGRQQLWRRTITLAGRLTPGSSLDVGDDPFAMYAEPAPEGCGPVPAGQRGEHARTRVLSIVPSADPDADTVVTLTESGPSGWPQLPMALTPKPPIRTRAQREAILEWGETLAAALPSPPDGPALDILRRRPPRVDGGLARTGDPVADIVASLIRMSSSYVAVQGPPGSGKTFVGAAVIAELARRGWRVGVVGQSHAVVENLLRGVLENGVPASRVGKKAGGTSDPVAAPWTLLENDDIAPFLDVGGVVLGGTAWDFANPRKVARRALDLLVIDEAGQYSLANTIAVAMGARRLLLLGDPQQLPQVSQGVHPEPIQTSALGWLSDGHDVLPDELGYFLAQSRRMHPELCAAVSELSYEGRLGAHPSTTLRSLDGIAPGLHPIPVASVDRSVESPEEAAIIVDLLRSLVGRAWSDPQEGRTDDQLDADDVIVVAPYNAQVALLRAALDAAGFTATRVGTVDRFQGQEAAVAIVSMTASSALDVPRGIDFLLLRNRLNVAISRAKWAAFLVHSPALRDFLPHRPEGVAALSGFIRLTTGSPQLPELHAQSGVPTGVERPSGRRETALPRPGDDVGGRP